MRKKIHLLRFFIVHPLLGLVLNNKMTWKNHLYGDKDNADLIPQLNKRLGMLKRLAKYMTNEKLRYFSSGIFYS